MRYCIIVSKGIVTVSQRIYTNGSVKGLRLNKMVDLSVDYKEGTSLSILSYAFLSIGENFAGTYYWTLPRH
jgi:hypothetical protein